MDKKSLGQAANMQKKTEILRTYAKITAQLCTAPFEELDVLFDLRANVIADYKAIDRELGELRGGEFDAAKAEQAAIIDAIRADDKTVGARLESFKGELAEEHVQLKKSKQIIDFMGSASAKVLFRGNALDEKM